MVIGYIYRKTANPGNQLSQLPPEIVQLTSLTQLDLSSNQLSQLPPEIGQLTSLTQLYLSSNQLSQLPPEIRQLTSLQYLSLQSNPIPIPPEILNSPVNVQEILDYYFQVLDPDETEPLYESKFIIVGEGGAGKTTLAKLLCRLYDPTEGRILWNGQDLTTLDLAEVRSRI
ncbi:MAG: leucine-rich repeat domain-containing protein, partial [Cyanobacteria bacterium J06656_5]